MVLALLVAAVLAEEPPPTLHREENRVWMVSPRFDGAPGGWSYGLGLQWGVESSSVQDGLGAAAWLGLGWDARLVTRDHHGLDGFLSYGLLHGYIVACAGGSGLELGLGWGLLEGQPQTAAYAAFYIGGYYLDLGMGAHLPVWPRERPELLPVAQFSLRAHIPVRRYDRRNWDEEPKP